MYNVSADVWLLKHLKQKNKTRNKAIRMYNNCSIPSVHFFWSTQTFDAVPKLLNLSLN